MAKCYGQYCPVAHALDLVGERWSLLIVRELLEEGPLRYSDLHARLDGCGTNILAARLKTLEQGGVVRRRQLDPPAASWVYELTEYGAGLRDVLHVLAHWGARSLGPPTSLDDLEPGWLANALCIALPSVSLPAAVEFRIGDEIASVSAGTVTGDSLKQADAIVTGNASELFRLLVDRDMSAVSIDGDVGAVEAMLASLPLNAPAAAASQI